MNDAYQKMSEMLDNWLSDNEKEIKIALIEKEILLEKIRNLYVRVSALETEEYAAPQQEKQQQVVSPEPETKREFTPAKTLEEDVDLFFDTEHESYKAAVEKELKEIAEEIEAKEQEQPVQDSGKEVKSEKKNEPVEDIFDHLEESEEDIVIDTDIHDNAEELFDEPDIEITASEEDEDVHEEDDILNFIPPKSTPVPETPQPKETPKEKKPTEEKKEPVVEKTPLTQKPAAVKPEPPEEAPTPKPQQRSLNDLFNEQREDHSISGQYQRAKVGDLTKAISINDKFIYIKELFHNRGEDFSAAIRQLNECKTMEEAFDCLEQLKQKFFWDSKSDAYLSFCDLLRRKYS